MKFLGRWCKLLMCSSLLNLVSCVYTPYDGIIKKPHLTPGIKTVNWNNDARKNILMHHNYSHVNYQTPIKGNALTPAEIYESTTKRIYPIYRPDFESDPTNVLNRTKPPEEQEPTTHQKVIIRVKKQLEAYDKCPPGVTGQLVYSLSCNQFLNCWKGRTFIQNCGPGTLFNPDTLSCDYPEKVQCKTGPRQTIYEDPPPAVLHTITARNIQPGCPEGFSGNMPNYSNCSKFIVCMNGKTMNQICPPGTLFDTNKNVCNHPEMSKCFNGQNQDSQESKINYFVVRPTDEIRGSGGRDYKPFVFKKYQTQHGIDKSGEYQQINCENSNGCPRPFATHPPVGTNIQVLHQLKCDTTNCKNPDEIRQEQNQIDTNDCEPSNQNCLGPITSGVGNPGYGLIFDDRLDHSNPGIVRTPNCFPPNCNPQSNANNGVAINPKGESPQYINCHPSNTNCRKQLRDNNRNTDSIQESSNQFNVHCDPNTQNCRTPSNGIIEINYGKQPAYPKQPVIDLNRGCRGNNCGQRDQRGYNQNTNDCVRENGECVRFPGPNSWQQGTTPTPNIQRPFSSVTHPEQVQCPPGESGIHPHPYDCSKFLNCASGQTFVQNCGPGTLFNPVMMTCDFDYNVQCNKRGVQEINDNYLTKQPTNFPRTTERTTNYFRGGKMTTEITHLTPGSNTVQYATVGGHYITRPPKSNEFYENSPDYEDIGPNRRGFATTKPVYSNQNIDQNIENGYKRETEPKTSQNGKKSPPPFLVTDTNADYVFVEEEGKLEPQNSQAEQNVDCKKNGFSCDAPQGSCVSRNLVCDGKQDCPTGNDEKDCDAYIRKFLKRKNIIITVEEKERWDNTTVASCAYLCLESEKFDCKSFNYRKIDNRCLLSDMNEGMTGLLMTYEPNDYYELISSRLDCDNMFKCKNNKCIDKSKICDGQNDCGEREDEKNCPAKKIGFNITLNGGKHPWEGRVEIEAFGKVGFICDDKFDIRDADVVCKELGYHLGAAEVRGNSYFAKDIPDEKVFYLMDDVVCNGNETSIRDCNFNEWGSHDCTNQEVVGVICKAQHDQCPPSFWKCTNTSECVPLAFVCDGPEDCTDGSEESDELCEAPFQVRLVNGTDRTEGRIEVKHHGVWGSVCDDDFNDDAAKVVCKNLGFTGGATVKKDAYFGQGVGPIWLDQVSCFGNESTLDKCSHWKWGEHNCDHSEDVGVICGGSGSYTERHSKGPQIVKPAAIVVDPATIYPASCGLRKDNLLSVGSDVHFRVVKGSKAKVGDYPWQAALRVKGKFRVAHWCGAVVISSRFVLTAAHCLVGYPKGAYVVVAGDYNIQEDEGTEQYAYIEDYYIHEDFRKGHKMNNDIALVKLKGQGFRLNGDVQAICLPDANAAYDADLNCTISGFGSIESGSSAFSNELRAGQVPLQPDSVCKMPHVYGPNLTDGMICAGTLDGGTDACDGDSGGPLACLDEGLFTLYGITSWGHRCGQANKPGVYVKVAHYRKWIDDKIKTNP